MNLIAFSTMQDAQSSKKKQFKCSAIGPSLLPWSLHCEAGLPVEMRNVRNENQLRLIVFKFKVSWTTIWSRTSMCLGWLDTFSTPSRWSLPCTLRTKVLSRVSGLISDFGDMLIFFPQSRKVLQASISCLYSFLEISVKWVCCYPLFKERKRRTNECRMSCNHCAQAKWIKNGESIW